MNAEPNWTLNDLIDLIRPRVGMFIGEYSITRLFIFLQGYGYAVYHHAIPVKKESPDFGKFNDWIARKFGWYESTAGWCNIILQETGNDEAKALSRFFQLLDEFRTGASPAAGA